MVEGLRRGPDLRQLSGGLLALSVGAAGAFLAWNHPLAPRTALIGFVLWCLAVARWPGVWLFIVPATLPVLNFAPWTGWLMFEEFDLLMLGVVAGGWANFALAQHSTRGISVSASATVRRPHIAIVGLASLFAALGVASLVRGVAAGNDAAFGWFQSYSDPLNSWRVFKSLLYAALIWPLLRREIRLDAARAVQRLASGMLVGLAVVSLAVIWERAAYPGLWNFAGRYRTTALFWEMHVGGAAIDAYLALATPFVAWALWCSRTPLRWAAAAGLALLTGYACLTTFSRGVYAAVIGPLLLLGLLLASQHSGKIRATVLRALRCGAFVLATAAALAFAFHLGGSAGAASLLLGLSIVLVVRQRSRPAAPWRPVAAMALGVALALEAVSVLGLGSFMRERVSASDHDLQARLVHWRNGLGLLHEPADWFWGIGLGRLPPTYARDVPRGEFPGAVQLVESPAGPGIGQPSASVKVLGPLTEPNLNGQFALTQRVALRPGPYRAAFDVRVTTQADVYLQLCEMHLLYARNCKTAFVRVGPSQWRRLAVPLLGPMLDRGPPWSPRLGVFSIAVLDAGGAAEFANVSLTDPDQREALVQGGFADGLARWFPAAQGYYLPWHIDNLYLEVLIERGAPALLVFVLCMGIVLWRTVVAASRASAIAPFLAAALAGGLTVGLVSSVLDVPRVAFLLFLLTLFSIEVTHDKAARER